MGTLKITLAMMLSAVATCSVRAESGLASFYGGGMTAGGVNRATELTAAHRTLAFGTKVRVTNVGNRETVVVRVTDGGPHRRGRIIDVSRAAARALDMIDSGTTMVSLELQ